MMIVDEGAHHSLGPDQSLKPDILISIAITSIIYARNIGGTVTCWVVTRATFTRGLDIKISQGFY